jgi:hypothetical protein
MLAMMNCTQNGRLQLYLLDCTGIVAHEVNVLQTLPCKPYRW